MWSTSKEWDEQKRKSETTKQINSTNNNKPTKKKIPVYVECVGMFALLTCLLRCTIPHLYTSYMNTVCLYLSVFIYILTCSSFIVYLSVFIAVKNVTWIRQRQCQRAKSTVSICFEHFFFSSFSDFLLTQVFYILNHFMTNPNHCSSNVRNKIWYGRQCDYLFSFRFIINIFFF